MGSSTTSEVAIEDQLSELRIETSRTTLTAKQSKEEREKHRRRGHFGDAKKSEDSKPDNVNIENDIRPYMVNNSRPVHSNQYNESRHQSPVTDLRQKLDAKKALNLSESRFSSHQNYSDQNYSLQDRRPKDENLNGNANRNRNIVSKDRIIDENKKYQKHTEKNYEYSKEFDKCHESGLKTSISKLPLPKKNTENFNPSYTPPEMRILFATPAAETYDRPCGSRDVIVVNDLFIQPGVDPKNDLSIYNQLLHEIQDSGVDENLLWQSWHGDSHLIADDKRSWKEACPTFSWVVDTMAEYFRMDVKATRLNWYRDSTDWKPFHHDAAAMKLDKARTQNITVAVSFGAERDAAFEHSKTRCTISMPQPNGTIYTFGRDVNILWRHGIPQLPPSLQNDEGRISIIAWGWVETFDM